MTISPHSFRFVSDLVRRETAMIYDLGKEYLVEARLLPLARALGVADVDAYVTRLGHDLAERARAINALTINETSWFRDHAPYTAFTDHILPDLLSRRGHTRTLSIWSAACSSGQEAYSLAMLLHDHLPPGWSAHIHATDVSTDMLERVNTGRYSQVEMNRGLPAAMLVRHFTRVGSEWEISADLRHTVSTRHLNLAAPFPPMPTFDLVMLRNVLIYFDVDTKRDILRRIRDVTSPDGYLVLGSTETTLDLDQHWVRQPVGRVQVHRSPHFVASQAAARQSDRASDPASAALTGA